jgi:acetoin utilization deacetylase AcuC-like enzyme
VHGTSADEYRAIFERVVDDVLARFAPDFVLVSAGFDCLAGDPLGGLLLEPADLHALTRALVQRAESACGGRVAVVLEGGYVPARVGEGARAVLRALGGLPYA